jgi:hypothetical protein
MRTEHKVSKKTNKYGQYATDVTLFDSVKEYMDFAVKVGLVAEGEKPEAQILRAINDYEGRRQLAKARPSKSGKSAGVRNVQKKVSEIIKSGEVSKEDLEAALEALRAKKAAEAKAKTA